MKDNKNKNNAYIVAENKGYISFTLNVEGVNNVLIKLVKPNKKLAYKIYKALGGK